MLYALLATAGASVNAPKTLCGMAVRERQREAAGTAGGALGLVGQLGASLAGFPVGMLLSVPAAAGAAAAAGSGSFARAGGQQPSAISLSLKKEQTHSTLQQPTAGDGDANKASWGLVLLIFSAAAAMAAAIFAVLAAEEANDAAEMSEMTKERTKSKSKAKAKFKFKSKSKAKAKSKRKED